MRKNNKAPEENRIPAEFYKYGPIDLTEAVKKEFAKQNMQWRHFTNMVRSI